MLGLTNKPVLVLNQSYEPITICDARRAVNLDLKGKVRVEESSGLEFYPGIALPSVIRLLDYKKIPHSISTLSRKNIYVRDRNQCQYCGVFVDRKSGTLDHIMPESRGGGFTWHNLVVSCKRCNHRKGNKTPEEAGMKLLHTPKQMSIHTSRGILRLIGLEEDPRWKKYLYN